VDFVLKPLDLITQVAQVLMDVVRTCFDQANGLWAGLQCVKRPVGQFADFPAQLGRTRPGAVHARTFQRVSPLRACHGMDSRGFRTRDISRSRDKPAYHFPCLVVRERRVNLSSALIKKPAPGRASRSWNRYRRATESDRPRCSHAFTAVRDQNDPVARNHDGQMAQAGTISGAEPFGLARFGRIDRSTVSITTGT
jgi:hypothetical protein